MDYMCTFFNVCLTAASGEVGDTFFGFAEFIGAFALLAIVFTIVDVQYRFRISVSPLPLRRITFWSIGVIGFGTLAADLWVSEGWLVIYVPYISYGVIQGLFATAFLATAMTWLYFAFLKPPIFSAWNAEKYCRELFHYLQRGSDSELPVIATEVSRSSEKLIEFFAKHRSDFQEQRQKQDLGEKIFFNPGNYAVDIISMFGNRKFCRHVVASSPVTAISLFQTAAAKEIYDVPMGQFAKNLTTEAILNPDSNLYHEDSYFRSGLLGVLKPFTQAIYGSYRIVEGLGHSSPLDVEFEYSSRWNSSQLEAYSRAVLATYADMLSNGRWFEHSYSLTRALQKFKYACSDIYKLDGVDQGDSDIRKRLDVSVRFVEKLIELLEKYEDKIVINRLKPDKNNIGGDIYDSLVGLMSEIIYSASGITSPWWPCWDIQHNTVWTSFLDGFHDSKTRRIIAFKLSRLIYQEIIELDKYTDMKSFKAARYLGVCLNCMGIKLGDRSNRYRSTAALQKVVLAWVKKNYVSLYKSHPTVANACLMGGITFDSENKQLLRTYRPLADREPNRDVLMLS